MKQRTIGFLIYDDFQALDVVGPIDAFGAANQYVEAEPAPYQLVTFGSDRGPLRAENGFTFLPNDVIENCPPLDTLVIPGGRGSRALNRHPCILDWIRRRAGYTRRVVSTCTGIYLLAATGWLNGCNATTHWRFEADVRGRFPEVRLDVDQLYVRDGSVYTSGGVTASMDLTLALIEEDRGSAIALAAARHLVMYMKRPGNQAQFSEPLQVQTKGQGPLALLPEWLLEHLAERLPVARMADYVNMSEWNFRRVFAKTFNMTPSRYLERLRLERARLLLTPTRSPAISISQRSD